MDVFKEAQEGPRKKVIYVAGAYSSEDSATVWNNIMDAREAGILIWSLGAVAIVPHLNTMFYPSEIPYMEYMRGDFEIIRRCDAIYMLHNYEFSTGALAEKSFAVSLELPVLYCEADVSFLIKPKKDGV